jgi:hypothetical protein
LEAKKAARSGRSMGSPLLKKILSLRIGSSVFRSADEDLNTSSTNAIFATGSLWSVLRR